MPEVSSASQTIASVRASEKSVVRSLLPSADRRCRAFPLCLRVSVRAIPNVRRASRGSIRFLTEPQRHGESQLIDMAGASPVRRGCLIRTRVCVSKVGGIRAGVRPVRFPPGIQVQGWPRWLVGGGGFVLGRTPISLSRKGAKTPRGEARPHDLYALVPLRETILRPNAARIGAGGRRRPAVRIRIPEPSRSRRWRSGSNFATDFSDEHTSNAWPGIRRSPSANHEKSQSNSPKRRRFGIHRLSRCILKHFRGNRSHWRTDRRRGRMDFDRRRRPVQGWRGPLEPAQRPDTQEQVRWFLAVCHSRVV